MNENQSAENSNSTQPLNYTNKRVFNTTKKPYFNNQNKKPFYKKQNNNNSNQNSQENQNNFKQKKFNNNFKSNEPKVKITFLGGVGEIGKNMTVFETKNDIFVLDSGLAFPDKNVPGVEVIVPDISYLNANKQKIRGFVITHGHEDHIGALPYVLGDIKAPIYASRFTLAMIENKMREHQRIKYTAHEVKPHESLKLGDFTLNFAHVNHSIVGALGLSIQTPAGLIVHTGDFKIDPTPVDGKPTDMAFFEDCGKRGVNLLMCESTNATSIGHSMSETRVGKVLDEEVFAKHKTQRLIISTFASNVHRLQQILSLAEKYGRKVVFSGRSMVNVSEVAMKLGELKYNKENVVNIDAIKKLADSEVLIICTGSQGEDLSALTRMANDEFPKIKLTQNDCVVFSSSPIPGNEKGIINVVNKLVHKGVEVINTQLAEVHASGHGYRDEIKQMHMAVKPKFLIPVHGEYLHFKAHKDLALSEGFADRQILVPDLGYQVELTANTIKTVGITKTGARLVDGGRLGDLNSPVIKDRKQLQDDGFVVVLLNISLKTYNIINDPLIITRGLLYNNEIDYITNEIRNNLIVYIKNYDIKQTETADLKNDLKKFVSNIIYRKTKRRPITIVTTNFVV